MIASTVATGVKAGVMGIATAATVAATAAQWALNFALTANPIGIVIVAIGALIGAVVAMVKYWDKVTGVFKKAWNWLKGLWDRFMKLGTAIKILAAILLLPMAPIIALIAGVVWLVRNWEKAWETIKNITRIAVEWLKDLVFGWWENVKKIFGWIPGLAGKMSNEVKRETGTIADTVENQFQKMEYGVQQCFGRNRTCIVQNSG